MDSMVNGDADIKRARSGSAWKNKVGSERRGPSGACERTV